MGEGSAQQVHLGPDQGAVEQLAAAGLHPTFHDCIHSRHLDPAERHFDACISENDVEQAGNLPSRSRIRKCGSASVSLKPTSSAGKAEMAGHGQRRPGGRPVRT
jgi:hypothetical protein